MAEQAPVNEHFLGLDEEQETFYKGIFIKSLVSSATFPLTCVKTLIQLGHEPFPLSTGKTYVVAGRNAYFLPNAFSFAKQLAERRGAAVLFTGLDSAILSMATQGFVTFNTTKYIDKHYPEIGGKPENLDADEKDLDDHQSFQRRLRLAIRDSVVRVAAVTVSRPFTVIMIRQIAQLIGNETKYGNTIDALRTIGIEEGPGGLFSGLVPQLVGELVIVWGIHSFTYFAERAVKHAGMYENQDEKAQKDVAETRKFINLAVPFVVNSFGYPYSVVSTVMAVAGSGLAVSFLPYSPSFISWHNAWDYLSPLGLKRGARLFLREQTGAVSVGPDQQLYASNKHFA